MHKGFFKPGRPARKGGQSEAKWLALKLLGGSGPPASPPSAEFAGPRTISIGLRLYD